MGGLRAGRLARNRGGENSPDGLGAAPLLRAAYPKHAPNYVDTSNQLIYQIFSENSEAVSHMTFYGELSVPGSWHESLTPERSRVTVVLSLQSWR